jgi:hypothetical protein
MTGLQPPKVTEKLVPVFTGGQVSRLEQACAGRGFPRRRDAARTLDRYIRARSRHAQAWRPQLWLGTSNRAR